MSRAATALATATAIAIVIAIAPARLSAQRAVEALPQWEGHLVPVLSPTGGAMAGAGLNVRAGWYARLGVSLTAGAVGAADAWSARQRIDATARFLFDPFAERARGFYAGAGIGAERDAGGRTRGLLLGVVGVEGAAVGRTVPAIELLLGGGARLGLVLRQRRAQGR